jgi:peroxin-19
MATVTHDKESTKPVTEETMDDDFMSALAKNMESLLKEQGLSSGTGTAPNDGELKDIMAALQDLASGKTPIDESIKSAENQRSLKTTTTTATANPIEAHVNRTLQKLRETETNQQQGLDAGLPGEDDPAMEAMMKELEGLLAGEDMDNVLGGLMDQIMSKELLHEPMKDLASKVGTRRVSFSYITHPMSIVPRLA